MTHVIESGNNNSERNYIFTERAHLMCPNMCFGIAMEVKRDFDEARIRKTLEVLAEAHPFLKARLGYEKETNAYFYDLTETPQTELNVAQVEITGAQAPEVIEEYSRITKRDFDLFNEGMLKVTAWKAKTDQIEQTVFLLVFHHLLADGEGALTLAKELADFYVAATAPAFAQEKLISSVGDFPHDSGLSFISRLLVKRANREWKKENHSLSYEKYHEEAQKFLDGDDVHHKISVTEGAELSLIIEKCHEHKVTVNDYLLSKLFTEENTKSIVIACDLRENLSCYKTGALGNYSTAFGILIKSKRKSGEKGENELFSVAKEVHKAVQAKISKASELYLVLQCYANLEPGLLDASMLSSRGKFDSKAAKFIGTMFFHLNEATGYSITNLGKTESETINSAYFIPPASPAIKKTLGVLTVNGRMTICTSER